VKQEIGAPVRWAKAGVLSCEIEEIFPLRDAEIAKTSAHHTRDWKSELLEDHGES
jgi:hypothetical protein